MGRGEGPVRVGELLGGALEELGPKGVWAEARVRRVWAEAVGERVARHAWVRRLRGRTLELGVDGDAWGTELWYLAEVVRSRVNALVGEDLVGEVVVAAKGAARRRRG